MSFRSFSRTKENRSSPATFEAPSPSSEVNAVFAAVSCCILGSRTASGSGVRSTWFVSPGFGGSGVHAIHTYLGPELWAASTVANASSQVVGRSGENPGTDRVKSGHPFEGRVCARDVRRKKLAQ